MARAPNEKQIKAEKLYKEGHKLIDISKKLDIPEGTIRSWKNRYNWDNDNNATLQKEEKKKRNVANKNATKKKTKKEPIPDEIKEVLENTELTDKQRLFCVIYSRCFNATKAYQKVYKCTYESAMVLGCNLLRNVKVRDQIESLKQGQLSEILLSKDVILQKYIDIAFADITDYVKFGKRDKIQYDSNGKPILDEYGNIQTYEESYVELGESNQVDGSLISEVSEGRDGIKFKLYDKMKALDILNKYYNLLDDETKSKLDNENKKLANDKLRAEITKITGEDEPEVEDDGFMEALKGRTAEVWKNE